MTTDRAYRTDRENEAARRHLEADLLETGWRRLVPGPKWLRRDDKLFEKKGRRILSDEIGAYTYRQNDGFWKRHRGIVGYSLARVLDVFQRPAWDETRATPEGAAL